MKINLRYLFAELQSLPMYVSTANALTEEQAETIAEKFGDCLEDTRKDFDYANEVSKNVNVRADTRGEGKNMFVNAERAYFGFIYDLHYVAQCESEEAARHGEFD